jgi:hypothetical protein
MNYARILAAAAAGTVVYFLYGFVVEGVLIREHFRPFAAVYRSAESLKPFIPLGMISTFIAILVTAVIYAKGYEGGSGAAEGFRFGLLIGVFVMCAVVGHNFVVMNIGRKLALELAVSVLVQWTLVETVVGLIYRPLRR